MPINSIFSGSGSFSDMNSDTSFSDFTNKDFYDGLTSSEIKNLFDKVETTIAHLFRFSHPALGGRAYGAAFCDTLIDQGLIDQETPVIVEVGGGLGDFAWAFVSRLRQHQINTRYTILDISAALQKEQQAKAGHLGNIAFVLADGQRLPFADGEITGTIISNEVIADFDAVELTPEQFLKNDDLPVKLLRNSFMTITGSLPQLIDNIVVNAGAIQFIQELSRVLKCGTVVVTEHGDGLARLITCGKLGSNNPKDIHHEVSINFEHLSLISNYLGFKTEIVHLIDFLPFDKEMRVANFNDAVALFNGDPLAGWPIAAIPLQNIYQFYGDDLTNAFIAGGLQFPAINGDKFPDSNTLPFSQSFKALILRKE